CDIPACCVGALLPHVASIPPRNAIVIPRFLGSTPEHPASNVAAMNYTTHFTQAGAGRQLHAPDATLTVVVGGEHTDDGYEIFEIIAPKMDPTPLHRTGWGKSYYVLDGRMLVFVDGESFELDP